MREIQETIRFIEDERRVKEIQEKGERDSEGKSSRFIEDERRMREIQEEGLG